MSVRTKIQLAIDEAERSVHWVTKKAGADDSTVRKWLRGEVADMASEKVAAIAAVLNLRLDWLFSEAWPDDVIPAWAREPVPSPDQVEEPPIVGYGKLIARRDMKGMYDRFIDEAGEEPIDTASRPRPSAGKQPATARTPSPSTKAPSNTRGGSTRKPKSK